MLNIRYYSILAQYLIEYFVFISTGFASRIAYKVYFCT